MYSANSFTLNNYFESGTSRNFWLQERNKLREIYGEKKRGIRFWWAYFAALPVDFINTKIAFDIILGRIYENPLLLSIVISAAVAVILALWIPYDSGQQLKEGILTRSAFDCILACLKIAGAIAAMIFITIIRYTGDISGAAASSQLMGNENIDLGNYAIIFLLTCIMVLTFLISLSNAYKHHNPYRSKFLKKTLERLYQAENNAKLRATLKEIRSDHNFPERVLKEAKAQVDAVLAEQCEMAKEYMQHSRNRLKIYCGNPSDTGRIQSTDEKVDELVNKVFAEITKERKQENEKTTD